MQHEFEEGPIDPVMERWERSYALWDDRTWITRRVDAIEFESSNTIKTTISFDIDLAKLNQILNNLESCDPNTEAIALPLLIQESQPFLNINLTLNGNSQSIQGGDQSARFSQEILFHHYVKVSGRCSSEKLRKYFAQVSQLTYDSFKDSAPVQRCQDTSDGEWNFYEELLGENIDDIPGFGLLISGSHILLAQIDRLPPGQNCVLKLELYRPYDRSKSFRVNRTSNKKIQYPYSLLGTSRENRYHLRIKVPPTLSVVHIDESDIARIRPHKQRRGFERQHPLKRLSNILVLPATRILLSLFSTPIESQPRNRSWDVSNAGCDISVHDRAGIPRRKSGVDTKTQETWIGSNSRKHEIDPNLKLFQLGAEGRLLKIRVEPQFRSYYGKYLLACAILSAFLVFSIAARWSPFEFVVFILSVCAFFVSFPSLFTVQNEDDFTSSIFLPFRLCLGFLVTLVLAGGAAAQISAPTSGDSSFTITTNPEWSFPIDPPIESSKGSPVESRGSSLSVKAVSDNNDNTWIADDIPVWAKCTYWLSAFLTAMFLLWVVVASAISRLWRRFGNISNPRLD